jgi:hypothetical protein
LRLFVAIALTLALAGCAHAPTQPVLAGPPSTAADPPPYVPRAQASGRPGAPVGLAVASGSGEARQAAIGLLHALVESDTAGMRRLLDERVARALPRVGPADRERAEVIAYTLVESRRGALGPTVALQDLLGDERLEVAPLTTVIDAEGGLPEGLRATDLVVSVPLSDLGRRALRRVLPGWGIRGRVIVRLGAEPRVVGL